uniref:adenylate cyclase n=1 Tax=Schistocephalus solidus TaxID=70667 RepID=A0A0X3PWB8_SCHSO
MRLGHNAVMRKALEKEQRMRKDMIQSLMPLQVAEEVMRGVGKQSDEDDGSMDEEAVDVRSPSHDSKTSEHDKKSKKPKAPPRESEMEMKAVATNSGPSRKSHSSFDENNEDGEMDPLNTINPDSGEKTRLQGGAAEQWSVSSVDRSLSPSGPVPGRAVRFRKFHVSQMENVSILFADIVGFTKMSSNKSASHLVYLLNDLFGRFDSLCELTKCEKIATLGDCYYCVSGCPNSVDDHAERIVEMGRAMCLAIQQFDSDHNEQVNMRVGVHTGKVICGLVGTRRFKFDVWSNDVTLANKMESSGEAGKVHISEATYEFVKDIYEVSDGEPVPDIRQIKVLVEFFNKEEQRYAIKHTQDQALIKTYFVVRRLDNKPVVVLDTARRISVEKDETTPKVSAAEIAGSVCIPFVSESNKTDSVNAPALNELALTATTGASETNVKFNSTDVEMLEALLAFSKPEEVFKFPPISAFSLCFTNPLLERAYRQQVLRIPRRSLQFTLATPRISPAVNAVAHLLFYLSLLIACFVNFPCVSDASFIPITAIVFACIGVFVNLAFLLLVIVDVLAWSLSPQPAHLAIWKQNVFRAHRSAFQWYGRNIFGAILICCPAAFILSNFQACLFWANRSSDSSKPFDALAEYRVINGLLYCLMLYSFTLFPNFSFWTKSLCAGFVSIVVLLLMHWPFGSISPCVERADLFTAFVRSNQSVPVWAAAATNNLFPWEMTVIILLNLLLVVALNREIDISFRANFNRDFEASCAKKAITLEKMQGEWLLENIIPRYVLTDLRKTNKYSQHVKDAGVIFASIANFSEFYDEQYHGGQEMLRVLNEIFADFEHLLHSSRFKDVEKIKTIAECFMAASGLNVVERSRNRRPDAHLFALMDFAMELIKILEDFNQQMFSFHFELKIGYNIGEVTAGVIGTTKLLYDIWGDAVNVASRMYSTGQKARIQVTEEVSQRLSSRYDFEYRGNVFVKGKGDMRTYLLVGPKADSGSGKPGSPIYGC